MRCSFTGGAVAESNKRLGLNLDMQFAVGKAHQVPIALEQSPDGPRWIPAKGTFAERQRM